MSEFTLLGAQRDLDEVEAVRERLSAAPAETFTASVSDADEGIVRRLVDAAIFKELLARETAAALLEATEGGCGRRLRRTGGGDVRVVAAAGCDTSVATSLARAASTGSLGVRRQAADCRSHSAPIRTGRDAARSR